MRNFIAIWIKRKVKLLLFLGLLTISESVFSALPPFTLTISPIVNETCISNGALNWTTAGTAVDADLVYAIYKSPNFTTAIATTTANSYGGLTAGTYRIIATQTLGGESNSASKDATIANTFKELKYTVASTPELCGNDGKITITTTAGIAATYALTAGPETRAPQTSNVFTALPAGTYTISVTDQCGNIKNVSGYALASTPSGFTVGVNRVTSPLVACDSVKIATDLSIMSGRTIVAPVAFTYTVHPPGGGATQKYTATYGSAGSHFTTNVSNIGSVTIPFYYGENYSYVVEAVDACGTIATKTFNFTNRKLAFNVAIPVSACAGKYLRVYNIENGVAPFQIEFVSAPAGFNPADYNSSWPGPYSTTTINFGSASKAVPEGSYTIKITDACGNSVEKTQTVSSGTPTSLARSSNYGCSANENYISLSASGTMLASATVTAAPAEFTATHLLPYTIPMYNGWPRLTAVPNGTYTFTAVDTCGIVRTATYTLSGYVAGTTTVTKTEKCGNFDLSIVVAGSNSNSNFYLQKYHPDSGHWGNPTSTVTQAPGSDIGSTNALLLASIQNGTINKNNIFGMGQFRIVRVRSAVEPGVPAEKWQSKQCQDVVEEFTFDQTLLMLSVYGFQCPGGTTTDVGVLASGGQAPLTYRITKKNGADFVVDNGTSNIFLGLDAGIYNFEVMDACGNTFNTLYDVTRLGLPKITPTSLCDGANGQLAVRGVPYLKFEWWKEGAEDTILSTAYNLPFSPFNAGTDQGKYFVRLTSPNGSSCVNTVLEFNLTGDTSNPKAGDDGTYVVDKNLLSVDLMDYLSGDYDTYGDFTETTLPASGRLSGSMFSPSEAGVGTYTFKYTVNGLCANTDEAIITIIVKTNYWIGTESTVWDNVANWTDNRVPQPNTTVEFATTANNNGNPAVKDLHVPVGDPKTVFDLTNESDKALVVLPNASITVTGTVTGSSTEADVNKIQIQAATDDTTPNGTFIATAACSNFDVYGTVQLFAQGKKMIGSDDFTWNDVLTGSPTAGKELKSSHSWQHFGVPVERIEALTSFKYSWIQKYSEPQNGNITGSGLSGTSGVTFYDKWNFVDAYDELKAFEGYEITQDAPTTYTIKGKLNFCDKELTLTRNAVAVGNVHYGLGQNIFGNSYTAAINLDNGIVFPGNEVSEVENTVYLYRTGSFQSWANGSLVTDGTTPNAGSYIAIPAKVGTTIWGNQIPSMQGFLLKFTPAATTFNGADRTVTLKYNNGGVVANTKPQLAPKAPQANLAVTLNSKTTVDKVWLFSQEGTSDKFDNGWDGTKYFGTPTAFIYSESSFGPLQVNTSDDLDGKVLTIYPNKDTDYTLTLTKTNLGAYDNLHLVDLMKRTVTPLTAETTTYHFTETGAGARVKRFIIVNSNKVDFNSEQFKLLDGYLQNNDKLVISNFTTKAGRAYLYDMAGKTVVSAAIQTSVTELPVSLKSGVYILNLEADGKQTSVKMIVK